MEVNVGSSPMKKENKTIIGEDGFEWIVTPSGLRFPVATKAKDLLKGRTGRMVKLSEGKHVHERFATEYPCVQDWLETLRSDGTRRIYGCSLLGFCLELDMSPKKFGDYCETMKDLKKAARIATHYILPLIRTSPGKAKRALMSVQSFFRVYSGGTQLPLDTKGILMVKIEDTEPFEKPRFNYGTRDEMREHVDRLILIGSRDLMDKMALTLLARTGLRSNTLNRLRVKHVQDTITVTNLQNETTELLCLTVTGEICKKTKHYKFPKLIDSPRQPRGYYTYLSGKALSLLSTFMATHHKNSEPDDLLFISRFGGNFVAGLLKRYKRRLLRSGAYPDAHLIRLHDFRWIFDELAHEVLKVNRAEMLVGHILKGVQEHYQKRNKTECAKDYLQIDFRLSKEQVIRRWKEDEARKEKKELETKPKEAEFSVPESVEETIGEGWQSPKMEDQAYKIIRRTYQEINSMKDDLSNILKGIDPRIEFSEEYSYGSNSLHLKEHHIFLFKKQEEEDLDKEFIVGVVILFSTIGRYKKVSSGDGPEIWGCKIETKNIGEKTRYWHILDCLKPEERKNFAERGLKVGGKIHNYHWRSEEKEDGNSEEWSGQFIGYPLTEIKDRTSIKEKIIDKLNI